MAPSIQSIDRHATYCSRAQSYLAFIALKIESTTLSIQITMSKARLRHSLDPSSSMPRDLEIKLCFCISSFHPRSLQGCSSCHVPKEMLNHMVILNRVVPVELWDLSEQSVVWNAGAGTNSESKPDSFKSLPRWPRCMLSKPRLVDHLTSRKLLRLNWILLVMELRLGCLIWACSTLFCLETNHLSPCFEGT
jgi:hypothetical protein